MSGSGKSKRCDERDDIKADATWIQSTEMEGIIRQRFWFGQGGSLAEGPVDVRVSWVNLPFAEAPTCDEPNPDTGIVPFRIKAVGYNLQIFLTIREAAGYGGVTVSGRFNDGREVSCVTDYTGLCYIMAMYYPEDVEGLTFQITGMSKQCHDNARECEYYYNGDETQVVIPRGRSRTNVDGWGPFVYGMFFNVKPTEDVEITGMDFLAMPGSMDCSDGECEWTQLPGKNVQIEVWTKTGSYSGHETNRNAWTRVYDRNTQTDYDDCGLADDELRYSLHVPIPVSEHFSRVTVSAYATQGFYVTVATENGDFLFSEDARNRQRYTNGAIQITRGKRSMTDFGGTYGSADAFWKGGIYYNKLKSGARYTP